MPRTLTQLSTVIILGMLPLLFLPALPDAQQLWLLTIAALFFLRLPYRLTRFIGLCSCVFIIQSAEFSQTEQNIYLLSSSKATTEVRIQEYDESRQKIRVQILRHQGINIFPAIHADLYGIPGSVTPCEGQRWEMTLQLRPVHASLNEGGFDRQRFMWANRTQLTGKALTATVVNAGCSWRSKLISYAQQQYRSLAWQSTMSALLFGERKDVPAWVSQLLRETGTAHLMAISGLHIAMAASCGWLLARLIQRLFPVHYIGFRFPLLMNLLTGAIYVWLSGGQPPAVRTLTVLAIWSVLRVSAIYCQSWQAWCVCVAGVLLLQPVNILSDSFWLSAIAAASLLIWYQLFPLPVLFATKRRWILLRLVHLQVGITLLLLPVQGGLFHGVSLSALLANLWAVPLVSFVSVPLLLLGLICSPLPWLSRYCWQMADLSLEWVFVPLNMLPAGWLPLSHYTELLCLISWIILISWRLGWLLSSPFSVASLIVAMFIQLNSSAHQPDWRMDMLDVGHGLAVVISRGGKALLYDSGNKWQQGDAAKSILIPWLRWRGLEPEQLILSHAHADHSGGLMSLKQAYPELTIRSAFGQPEHLLCRRGESWQWQQLQFKVLWPEKTGAGGNNDSCVVMVSDGQYRVLLTGDLEMSAELKLVADEREHLVADIIQVPHHGSKTSSSPAFLRATQAKLALASVARYNPWRLPAAKIIRRYQKLGILWHDTAVSGQLSVWFYPQRWQVKGLREQILPRWYHRWFGVARDSG